MIPNPGTTADNILDNTTNHKAVSWLKWFATSLSLQKSRFNPRPVHGGFVADKVSLVPHFSPSTSVLSASLHQCPKLIHSLTINMTLVTDSDVKTLTRNNKFLKETTIMHVFFLPVQSHFYDKSPRHQNM